MYSPSTRERVQIAGRAGIFIVVRVDDEEQRADVVALTGKAYLEENVPFSALRPYKEDSLETN